MTCVTLVYAAFAQAETPPAPEINLFGDEFPAPTILRAQNGRMVRRSAPAPKPAPGYLEVLLLGDGREVHGELAELDKGVVVWRRADASEPLRIPVSEVRRITTARAEQENTNGFFPGGTVGPANAKDKPLPATLKLPGGDWLFGKVASSDGQSFTVQLESETQATIARPQIEWMEFGHAPAPAFGYSGSVLDMEGWLPATAAFEVTGKTLTVNGASWIGRSISPPERFELSFELPENTEDGTRLWLQTCGPETNCFSTGTVELRFDKTEISYLLCIRQLDQKSIPLPKEARQEKGPVKYRVFYDGSEKHLIVQRNGRQVGDWKFADEKDKDAAPAKAEPLNFEFNAICFDREDRGGSPKKLQLNSLRFQPWDGSLPKEGETEDGQDRLSVGDDAPILGKLHSIADDELGFTGEYGEVQVTPFARVTRRSPGATDEPAVPHAGTFIRLARPAAEALAGAEAKVSLGSQGEFKVSALQIHDGKIHCATTFAKALELPAKLLRTIAFPVQPAPASVGDILIFKNGDELPGKALSAALNGPVRWRMGSGQEVEFQPERIAGLRLDGSAGSADGKVAESTAVVELRSGEQFHGKLLAYDENQVRLEHPQFGALALARSQLWRLFPNPRIKGVDGGGAPGGWKWSNPQSENNGGQSKSPGGEPFIQLDGTYVARAVDNTSFSFNELPGLQHEMNPALDQFELRVQAITPGAWGTCFVLQLNSKEDTGLNAYLSNNQLQMSVASPRGNRQPRWHNIPLDKLGETSMRRALRLFVDTKAGTCDVVINGVHLARLGQEEGERLRKSQYTVRIAPYPGMRMPTILSHVWLGPWNGELPHPVPANEGSTALDNGDLVLSAPKAMHDGKFTVESELGELQLPVGKALVVDFGGAMDTHRAAARVRLADGSAINVDGFQWDGHGLAAHSAVLGDVRLPAEAVRELVFDPPAPRPPEYAEPKTTAQAGAEKTNEAP